MLASVTIHEWGHFITARRFGMKATQFMVGFGPTIWSKVRGETEYGVKALPLGGYVKIMGMTDLEPVAPEDLPRAFYRQPPGRRAVVLVSGSVMHFVIAAVLLFLAPMAFGIETQPTTTIRGVGACAPDQPDGGLADPDTESPAVAAGLQPGDQITSVAGEPIETWEEFTASLVDKPGQTIVIGYERDGEPQTATITVAEGQRVDPDDPDKTVVRGVIGVSPGAEAVRESPGEAFVGVGTTMVTFVSGTFDALWQLPAKIPALWDSLVNDAPRDPNGLVGVVGISRVGSDILSDDEDAVHGAGGVHPVPAGGRQRLPRDLQPPAAAAARRRTARGARLRAAEILVGEASWQA